MTKRQLQEYYYLKKNIRYLEDKLLELETKATKMSMSISDMPRSGDSTDMADVVIEMVKVKIDTNEQLQKSYKLLAEIEKSIKTLPEREQYLIRARYIEDKSWEQIAVDMNYSWRQIHNIHSKALKALIKKDCTQLHIV